MCLHKKNKRREFCLPPPLHVAVIQLSVLQIFESSHASFVVFLVPLLFFRCEFLVTLCSGCLVFHLLVVQFLLKRIVALCIPDGNHDHNDHESQSAEPEEGVDDVENCIKNVFHIVAFLLLAKKIIIAVVVGEVGEIISCAAVSTQRLAVSDLLDISKTTGHALVSVGVESVESDRYPCIAAAVNFAAIKNRLNMSINDLGRSGAVGIDEEAVLVGLVITLNITVAERELDRSLVRLLAAELADAVLDSGIDCLVDGVNRPLVGLRDDQRNAVLFLAAVDGLRFPYICIRESYDTGYDFCRMIVNRHN